jgi:hypothetical protein
VGCRARELNPHWILVALTLPKQLRQPRDIDGDPPRLVRRQHLRLPRLGLVIAGIKRQEIARQSGGGL